MASCCHHRHFMSVIPMSFLTQPALTRIKHNK